MTGDQRVRWLEWGLRLLVLALLALWVITPPHATIKPVAPLLTVNGGAQ